MKFLPLFCGFDTSANQQYAHSCKVLDTESGGPTNLAGFEEAARASKSDCGWPNFLLVFLAHLVPLMCY